MPKVREDIIHYSVRQFLKVARWQLIAGQYPDGSDDELPPLNVVDPALARDNSPEPRRHSMNKIVPDLVVAKGNITLVIEMKPYYSRSDAQKLEYLLGERRPDLLRALAELSAVRGVSLPVPIPEIIFVPCLGLSASVQFQRDPRFCYFTVKDMSSVAFEGNEQVPAI